MAQAKCIGRYESIYDLEEACFRNYRETMQTILQTTGNITDAEWGRNHDRYRDNVIHDFDKNCGHFKKRDLVRNVRESLIERIETENLDLIKLYELRTMNQAMQESLQESKATTDKSRETVTQLKSVREEQNKTLEENNARLARLSSQQSNAREQYSNMSKELAGVEEYMAKLERQRQDQNREQHDLEEQARRNAEKLEELKKLSEQKKKSRWFKKPSWLFGSSKSDDKSSQNDEPFSGYETYDPHPQRDSHGLTNYQPSWNTKSDKQSPEDYAGGLPVLKGSYEPQRNITYTERKDTLVTPAQIPHKTPATNIPPKYTNIGGNETPRSLQNTENDMCQNTTATNPAASDEYGTDFNPKHELSSISSISIAAGGTKKCDRVEGHVDNISLETRTVTKETSSWSGMNSKYNAALEECTKTKKQHTEPNVSQTRIEIISEYHDTGFSTQNKMEFSSEKNIHTTSKVGTCRVYFGDSGNLQNPGNVTQKLTDNCHEIPKIVSKDDLIDLGNREDNNSDATIDGIETSDSKNKSLISTETRQDLSSINFEPNAEGSFSKKDENVEASKYNMPPVDDNLVTPETKPSEYTSVTQISTSEIDTTSKSTNPFGAFYQSMKNPAPKFPSKNAERVTGSGQTPNEYSVQSTEGDESFNQDDKHNQQPMENQSQENSLEEQQTNGFKIVNLI